MNTSDKQRVLAEKLEEFRQWSYEALAAEIDRTRMNGDCLTHVEGVFTDGTEYQIEINVFWDDKRGDDVRVIGDLEAMPQRPVMGVYTSDVVDSFIMRRDGSFVDE